MRVRATRRVATVALLSAFAGVTTLAGQRGGGPPASPNQTQTQAPVDGTGAISGVATDSAGAPLAGVVVTLSGFGRNTPAPAQVVDDKGRFVFTKLPPGDYTVSARKLGLIPAPQSRRITLTDGQWVPNVKMALSRYSSITGTVTDEAGEPVVNTPVRVIQLVMVAGNPQLAAGTIGRTDDRGMYRVARLTPGKYLVVVPSVQWSVPAGTPDAVVSGDNKTIADGGTLLFVGGYMTPPVGAGARRLTYPATFYPSARSPRDAAVVDVPSGQERSGIDLTIRPVPTVRVSGRLEAPADAQAAGLTLRLMAAGSETLATGSETATAMVAPDNTFTFLNVPAGDYTIIGARTVSEFSTTGGQVSLPTPPGVQYVSMGSGQVQSATDALSYAYTSERGSQAFSARMSISVGDQDLSGLVVAMRRAATISGRVVNETTAPEGRRPTSGVTAEPADGNISLGMPRAQVDQTAGTFTVEGVLAGRYMLRATPSGSVKSIVCDGRDYTYTPFDATDGRSFTNVVITITDKTAKLAGYVRDELGQVAKAGAVIVFPAESEQWSGYGFQSTRITSGAVGTNGAYLFGGLPAGSYFVIAVDESLANARKDPSFLAAARGLASSLTVDWGESKTMELTIKQVPGFRPK